MSNLTHQLVFDTDIGSAKPVTVVKTEAHCPFCCEEDLADGVLERDGEIIWVKNKYPVLKDAFQTVLVETSDCNSELSLYTKEHLYKVVRFGLNKWQEMMESGQYKSVLFFKNHGPYSGGTIRHPHMQIVGLKNVDYTVNIPPEALTGNIICQDENIELNLSTQPRIGFFEFNIRTQHDCNLEKMADYIQMMAHYLLNHFHKSCNSYNIFFYQINNEVSVKIMPRFIMSPLFAGYSIPQVSTRADKVIADIKRIYLSV